MDYSVVRATLATQQTLFQVSQSATGDLFDRHASLPRFWLSYFFHYSCRTKRKMSEHSELYNWLNSLPGGLHLERCSKRVWKLRISIFKLPQVPTARRYWSLLSISGKTFVGRKTHFGKRNEGFPRLGKQANTIETHRTFLEVQHFWCFLLAFWNVAKSVPADERFGDNISDLHQRVLNRLQSG